MVAIALWYNTLVIFQASIYVHSVRLGSGIGAET